MSKPLATLVVLVVLLSSLAGVAGAATDGVRQEGVDRNALSSDEAFAQTAGAGGTLESGHAYWTGQGLRFDASAILDGGDGRTFEVWRVTAEGRLNQRVTTFTVDESGTHRLQTGGLVGRYVLRYREQAVYVQDGVGYLSSPPDGSQVTVGASSFSFQRQTLAFEWSDPDVYPGQSVTLTMTSNRADYVVAVSGGNLTFDDLTSVFPESAYADGHDARSNDSVLLVRGGARTSYHLDTAALEPGKDLEFDVVDAAASRAWDLTVRAPGNETRFVSLERRENVGDVVSANVSCTHCFLVVGGPEQGVLDVVELEDSNDDGYVRLDVNTRFAGMYQGATGYPSGVAAYTSPDDSVTRYPPGAALEQIREELTYNVGTLSELRDQEGLASTGRDRPLGPGEIDLTLAETDFLIDRSAYGDRSPFGSQLVIRDQTDVRTLTLEPRSLEGVTALGAPAESAPRQTAERLGSVAAPRDRLALGDDLVFRIELSGVFGYVHARGADRETLAANKAEGIYLELERLAEDGSATALPLDRTAIRYLPAPSSDALYIVVDSAATGPNRLKTGQYRLSFELRGVTDKYEEYSTKRGHEGYPYLAAGSSESVSAVATIAPPEADITEPGDDEPHVNADWELVVGGSTTVAPESPLRVTASASEYAWETSADATVDASGQWQGTLDLADAPGEEFTVSVSREGEQLAERRFTVRPPAENSSAGGGGGSSDGGGSGGASAGGPLAGDDGILSSIPGLSALPGLAVPIGGGLGALVVVWMIWKLVIKRVLLS